MPEAKATEQEPLEDIFEDLQENATAFFESHPRTFPEDGLWVALLIDYRWFNFRWVYDNISKTFSIYSQGEAVVGQRLGENEELVAQNMSGPAIADDGTYFPPATAGWFEVEEVYGVFIVYYDGLAILTVVPENPVFSIFKVLSPENITYNVEDVPLECMVNLVFYNLTYSLDGQANQTRTLGDLVLTGLSEGLHSIVVYVECEPMDIFASETIYFTVSSTSTQSVTLPPQNKTTTTNNITLTLPVEEEASLTNNSLDEKNNSALTENTKNTTGLTNGSPNLTVYAADTAVNAGKSETISFAIDNELEPAPTTWTTTAVAIVTAMLVASVPIYFTPVRKRKP